MEKISQKLIIDNGFRKVYQTVWKMENGREGNVITTGNSNEKNVIMVVPITRDGNILFLREFRF
jgi:hypothetical protein